MNFAIENLLPSSEDRGLYEAVWLLSVFKNNRSQKPKYDLNKVSVENIW